VLKTLDMEANQTGARHSMSSQFVLACCSRGKFTSSAEQNALSYVNCIIWDLSVCLSVGTHSITTLQLGTIPEILTSYFCLCLLFCTRNL